jgi:DnaJ-domain-containing protein 1
MEGTQLEKDAHLVIERVIAFQKDTARYRPMLDRERGATMGAPLIIKLALGKAAIKPEKLPNGVNQHSLMLASCFFVAEAFTANPKDYYRVLGVPRDASETQIKEHYRYLMLLTHPDRPSEYVWPKHVVPAITAAYEALNDPYQRGRYDQDIDAIAAGAASMQAGFRRTGSFEIPKEPPQSALRAWLSRWGPKLGAASALALVLLGVGAAAMYIFDGAGQDHLVRRKDAPIAAQTIPTPTMRLATTVSAPDESGVRPAVREDSRPVEVPSVIEPVVVYQPASKTVKQAKVPDSAIGRVEPSQASGQVQPELARPEPVAPTVSQVVVPVTAAPVASSRDKTSEIDALLQSFTRSYAEGNIEAMSSLFDANTSGRYSFSGQRKGYLDTFESTQERRLNLSGIEINDDAHVTRVRADGVLSMRMRGSEKDTKRTVSLEFEIQRVGGRPVISYIKHGPKQS